MKDNMKGLGIIRVAITYILVRILFKLFNSQYDIVGDIFNALKLIIDLGTWIVVWTVVSFVLKKCNKVNRLLIPNTE